MHTPSSSACCEQPALHIGCSFNYAKNATIELNRHKPLENEMQAHGISMLCTYTFYSTKHSSSMYNILSMKTYVLMYTQNKHMHCRAHSSLLQQCVHDIHLAFMNRGIQIECHSSGTYTWNFNSLTTDDECIHHMVQLWPHVISQCNLL